MEDEAEVLLIIPPVANCLLVPTDYEIAGVKTACIFPTKFRPLTASLRQAPATTQESALPGYTTIRQTLEAQGFQGDVCEIMCALWRETVQKQYEIHNLQKRKQFCGGKKAQILFMQMYQQF